MRFFDNTDGKRDTLMMLDFDEGKIIIDALSEFCRNNKKKIKAKKILEDMLEKWSLY